MCKLSAEITEIEGKEGGTIFRYDQCGQHAQAYVYDPERNPSPKQIRQQGWFRMLLVRYWHKIPTAYWPYWWRWSEQHPVISKKGEIRYMQPHNAYLKVNLIRLKAGLSIIDMPPGYTF